MPIVAITRPTTLRELLFDEQNPAEIAASLAARLPDALLVEQLSGQRQLPRTAYRLLNARIAALAVEFLDHDVVGVVVSALGRSPELVRAAEDTRGEPGTEVVVHLAGSHPVEAGQRPYVDVVVDDRPVARVTFDLAITFELGETVVAVRDAAMVAVDCTVCAVTVTFTVDGWSQALLTRRLSVPLRLTLHPPVAIPPGPAIPAARPGSEPPDG